jgi:hypothetical protein
VRYRTQHVDLPCPFTHAGSILLASAAEPALVYRCVPALCGPAALPWRLAMSWLAGGLAAWNGGSNSVPCNKTTTLFAVNPDYTSKWPPS